MKKTSTLKTKFLKLMKICTTQLVIAITFFNLAFSYNNYGQVLDKKITITLKEVSIEEALEAIEQLTNVKFFYSVDQLNVRQKISLKAVDQSLGDVLNELLTPHKIQYKVHERKYTITLKRQTSTSKPDLQEQRNNETPGLNIPHDQAATISGNVTDAATEQP